jgi:hypothetical protein
MEISSHIKFTLSDEVSLATYLDGQVPDFDSVRRQLWHKAREQNRNIPDQFYRLEQKRSFEGIESIASLLTDGFFSLSDVCLDRDANDRVFVKDQIQNEWQELITYIPPLVLQCALVAKKEPEDPWNGFSAYFNAHLLVNFRYTALPSSRLAQLDHILKEKGGLHDLHMHLSGATETDVQWQDFLKNPTIIFRELTAGFKKDKVREQLLQESPFLTPFNYIKLLRTAQKLRYYFYEFLIELDGQSDGRSLLQLLSVFNNDLDESRRSNHHDFANLLPNGEGDRSLLAVEALMYVLILKALRRSQNETLAHLFHFYLLLLGLTNRLLVQQVHQKGFEQFQKHTLNRLREYTELKYKNRFLQIQGNDLNFLRFLEGRFSPKSKRVELVAFITEIYRGWQEMESVANRERAHDVNRMNQPELKLVAHFIKMAEGKKPDSLIRHRVLRYDVWKKAKVLAGLRSQLPRFKKQIVGIDAAASEFDAPPEVFAPAYRLLRRSGYQHFTYHAGEDFYHILGGLRAIYEAIVFCGLREDDRIGHATAAGIDAKQWNQELGGQLLMRQGDYLDDLVFVYYIMRIWEIADLYPIKDKIASEVHRISEKVYGQPQPLEDLERAWQMRELCPVHALSNDRSEVSQRAIYSLAEWDLVTESGLIRNRNGMDQDPAWRLYQRYHDNAFRQSYDDVISVRPFGVFEPKQIEILQLALLDRMSRAKIVIETLPTSNVRIGFHRNFNSYHLLRWTDWRRNQKEIPPIVVGTDDTGIFATNIYNEYSNIYCCMKHENREDTETVIAQLNRDSERYRFEVHDDDE